MKRADCTTGPTKTTLQQALARAFQAKHLKTTSPEMRIPLHLQRRREASRSNAPAQRNSTSSLRSYDSRTGPTKTAHHKSSNSRVLRFPTGRAITQSYERLRTVAQHPANNASPPDPQNETRSLCYAFGKHPTISRESPRTRMHITLRNPKKIVRENIFRYKPGARVNSTARTIFSACKTVLCVLDLLLQSYDFQAGAGHLHFAY